MFLSPWGCPAVSFIRSDTSIQCAAGNSISCIPDCWQELYINGRLGFTKQETSHVGHRNILFCKVMKGQQKHSTEATGLVKLQVSGCEGRPTQQQVLHGRRKSLIALWPVPNWTERLQGGATCPEDTIVPCPVGPEGAEGGGTSGSW
jgi:hypothetical protein